RVERTLAVLEVEEYADAGLHDLLERVRGLDLFASEARLLGHDEHLERRPRLERVHQPEEPRALHELRAPDPVVGADVRVGYGAALVLRVGARVLHLPGDRLLRVGKVLISALARVDRGDHAAAPTFSISVSSSVFAAWVSARTMFRTVSMVILCFGSN